MEEARRSRGPARVGRGSIVTFGHGLVVGKFYPPHLGHLSLIRAAADACERVTVVVAASSVETLSLADRVEWLGWDLADRPHVTVVGVMDDHPVDYYDPEIWDAHMVVFEAAIAEVAPGAPVDAVFSGESYGDELALSARCASPPGGAARDLPFGHCGPGGPDRAVDVTHPVGSGGVGAAHCRRGGREHRHHDLGVRPGRCTWSRRCPRVREGLFGSQAGGRQADGWLDQLRMDGELDLAQRRVHCDCRPSTGGD